MERIMLAIVKSEPFLNVTVNNAYTFQHSTRRCIQFSKCCWLLQLSGTYFDIDFKKIKNCTEVIRSIK